MALDGNALGNALLVALNAAAPITSPAVFCNVLGTTIVTYFKANAVVDPLPLPDGLQVEVLSISYPITGLGRLL